MVRELYGRPLLVLAAGLVLGILARELVWLWTLAVLLVLLAPGPSRPWAVVAVVLGAFLWPGRAAVVSEPQPVAAEIRVTSVPRAESGYESAVVELQGYRFNTTLPASLGASLGDRLAITGSIEPYDVATRVQRSRQGISGRLKIVEARLVDRGTPVWRWGRAWRDSFRSVTHQHLSPSARQLADAVCFNVDGGLDDEIRQDLQSVGVIHIVSASGLHVGIFAVFLNWVLGRLPIDRRYQILILLGVLVLYMGAAGLRPPVIRAVAMAMVILPSYLWRKEGDLLSAMALAGAGNLLVDPRAVWDVGFQLSFIAVLAIGLYPWYPPARKEGQRPWTDRLIQTAWVSLVVTLGTGPLTAYYFGYVSLIGIVANLVAGGLVTMIVVGALAAWSLSWIPFVAGIVMSVVEGASALLLYAVRALAALPFASATLPTFSAVWILVCWGIGLALWRHRVRPA